MAARIKLYENSFFQAAIEWKVHEFDEEEGEEYNNDEEWGREKK